MDWSQITIRKIRGLIVFTILILVGLWKYEVVLQILGFLWGIFRPFVIGGAIAFVLNVPMTYLERRLFGKDKEKRGRMAKRLARPASLVLTLALVIGLVALVLFVLVPQLGETISSLGDNLTVFLPRLQAWVREFTNNNAEVMRWMDQLEFQPQRTLQWLLSFLSNGAGSMMNTTMAAVGSVISGVATFFVAFFFAIYILVQKEKLHVQARKVVFAFIPRRKAEVVLEICALAHQTFSSFLTGQCLEAVILGSMFVVAMTVFRFPYALLTGIVIAFTALIPIFGAFIGCGIGVFLIAMVSVKQALLFIVLFLVLQQIEGSLIYPHVVGNSVGLPSIWVMAAVSLGSSLMGIVGMLIFIPIVSVLYSLFREVVYLKLKKQRIKRVTADTVEEYTPQEVARMQEIFEEEQAMRQ